MPSIRMSEHAAWVTWDVASNGTDEPFKFAVPRCADQIRSCMGLPYEYYGEEILLISYLAAEVATLFRPTCADAELQSKFYPAPPPPPKRMNAHGWTRAWTEWPPHPPANRLIDATGQPEAVHASAFFPPSVAAETLASLIP